MLNPDLSEQYLLSCIHGAGGINGGASWIALELLINTNIPIRFLSDANIF